MVWMAHPPPKAGPCVGHACETGFYGISRNIIPGIRLYTTTPTSNAVVSDALTSMLANFGKPNFQTRARVGHFHLVYNKRPDVRVNRLQACPICQSGSLVSRITAVQKTLRLAEGARQCTAGS